MRRPVDLRAEAARARDEAARLLDYAQALDAAADAAELTRPSRHRIVSSVDVNQTGLSSYTKRAATRSSRESEAQRKLYEKDVTIAALARELNEKRARVSSWFAPRSSDGNRPIPRRHAEYISAKYGVPLADWPRIDG